MFNPNNQYINPQIPPINYTQIAPQIPMQNQQYMYAPGQIPLNQNYPVYSQQQYQMPDVQYKDTNASNTDQYGRLQSPVTGTTQPSLYTPPHSNQSLNYMQAQPTYQNTQNPYLMAQQQQYMPQSNMMMDNLIQQQNLLAQQQQQQIWQQQQIRYQTADPNTYIQGQVEYTGYPQYYPYQNSQVYYPVSDVQNPLIYQNNIQYPQQPYQVQPPKYFPDSSSTSSDDDEEILKKKKKENEKKHEKKPIQDEAEEEEEEEEEKEKNEQIQTDLNKEQTNLNEEIEEGQVYKENLYFHKGLVFFQFNSQKILKYDHKNSKWEELPNTSNYTLLEHFRVAELSDGSFLLTGGQNQGVSVRDCVHYENGVFSQVEPMNQARDAHSTIRNNEYVYVFGGQQNGQPLSHSERYNLREKRWEVIGNLNTPRTLAAVCNFNKNFIYVFGGWSETQKSELDSIERYDISTNTFEQVNFKMPEKLQNSFVVQINPKQILILGGWSDKVEDSEEVNAIDVYTGDIIKKKNLVGRERGWSIYPPYCVDNKLYLFMTGEEEDGDLPDIIEYSLN